MPISVSSPTFITTPTPEPSVIFVDLRTKNGAKPESFHVSSSFIFALFPTATDSPVIVLSSTLNSIASRSSISAGISSPALRITISPTTNSSLGISIVVPLFLITFTFSVSEI